MAEMQRRLAHHQNQTPPLLQAHIGGAREQRRRNAGRDLGHRANGARRNDHAGGAERSARDGRAEIGRRMRHARKRLDVLRAQLGFVAERHLAAPAEHEVGFHLKRAQGLEQAHAIGDARGSADADDEPHRCGQGRHSMALSWWCNDGPPRARSAEISGKNDRIGRARQFRGGVRCR